MPVFNMQEAKTHLSKLVKAASEGEEVVIAKAGIPAAKLVPITRQKQQPIRLGVLQGKVWVADDFDAPLPDDILDSFEGK